jgi:hypothetical protein
VSFEYKKIFVLSSTLFSVSSLSTQVKPMVINNSFGYFFFVLVNLLLKFLKIGGSKFLDSSITSLSFLPLICPKPSSQTSRFKRYTKFFRIVFDAENVENSQTLNKISYRNFNRAESLIDLHPPLTSFYDDGGIKPSYEDILCEDDQEIKNNHSKVMKKLKKKPEEVIVTGFRFIKILFFLIFFYLLFYSGTTDGRICVFDSDSLELYCGWSCFAEKFECVYFFFLKTFLEK